MKYFISYTYEFHGEGRPSFNSIEVDSYASITCIDDIKKILSEYRIFEKNLTILYWRRFENAE